MNQPIPQQIQRFIRRHHVLTLATAKDGVPWACSCFYAFDAAEGILVFTSEYKTRHIEEALLMNQVAGTIALETKIIGRIRGIQFAAQLIAPENELLKKARRIYLLRFPFAAIFNAPFWVLKLETVKMTDNRLGFGRKLYWPDLK